MIRITAAVAAALTSLAVTVLPAHAVQAPTARDDRFTGHGRGVVTGNVLANDSWDPSTTVAVTDVHVVSSGYEAAVGAACPATPTPTVSFTTDGQVDVDFDAYPCPAYPGRPRVATLSYTITDGNGQTATAAISVTEYAATSPVVVADDTVSGSHTVSSPTLLTVLRNDQYGDHRQYALEITAPPAHGTATPRLRDWSIAGVDYLPDGTAAYTSSTTAGSNVIWYSDPVDDTWSYRFCLVADPASCSPEATVTMRYRATKITSVPSASLHRAFWDRSAVEVSFDPGQALVKASGGTITAETLAGLHTVVWQGGPTAWQHVTTDGGATGPWEVQRDTIPDADDQVLYDVRFRNDSGSDVGRVLVTIYSVSPKTPVTAPSEAWVAVGQTAGIPALLDADLTGQGVGEWADNADGSAATDQRWPLINQVTGASHGTLDGWWSRDMATAIRAGHPGDPWSAADGINLYNIGIQNPPDGDPHMWRLSYTGTNPGIDVLAYGLCPAQPGTEHCTPGEITVHVSPLAEAVDDVATTDPGAPVAVEVLANDVFTDGVTEGDAAVTLTDVPAGVAAVVSPDRTVSVTPDVGYSADTVAVGYRLTDYTGTATARITVAVTQVTPPPPPPPAAAPPVARDDAATMTVDENGVGTVTIPVLDNDTYGTNAAVWVTSLPDGGFTAEANPDGTVTFSVWGITADRIDWLYDLTDDGGRASAQIHITVVHPPVDPVVDPRDPDCGNGIQVDPSTGECPVEPVEPGDPVDQEPDYPTLADPPAHRGGVPGIPAGAWYPATPARGKPWLPVGVLAAAAIVLLRPRAPRGRHRA
jgi:hypothetical protein